MRPILLPILVAYSVDYDVIMNVFFVGMRVYDGFISASDFLRQLLANFISQLGAKMKPPAIDREGAFEIARELRKIGGNVNQIAKQLNQGQKPLEGQIEGLERELHALWQLFNSALQK